MSDYAHKRRPPLVEVGKWLEAHHGNSISELNEVRGGWWSSAWSYRCGDEAFVLRSGASDEGYRIDAAAHGFAEQGVPVPEVIHIGEGLGGHVAVSRRHFGSFVEEQPLGSGAEVASALDRVLRSMRKVPLGDAVEWWPDAGGVASWHDWLRRGFVVGEHLAAAWSATVEEVADFESTFADARTAFERLLPLCPERRDLVHGDLLHQNVLVDGGEVTGIFSWKCSSAGDFMYDVALCSIWRPWHPVIAEACMYEAALRADDLTDGDLANARERHLAYQLQIGLAHLVWFVESGNREHMGRLIEVVRSLLVESAT